MATCGLCMANWQLAGTRAQGQQVWQDFGEPWVSVNASGILLLQISPSILDLLATCWGQTCHPSLPEIPRSLGLYAGGSPRQLRRR